MAGFAPQCTFSLIKQQQSHNSLNETGTNLYGTQDSFYHFCIAVRHLGYVLHL